MKQYYSHFTLARLSPIHLRSACFGYLKTPLGEVGHSSALQGRYRRCHARPGQENVRTAHHRAPHLLRHLAKQQKCSNQRQPQLKALPPILGELISVCASSSSAHPRPPRRITLSVSCLSPSLTVRPPSSMAPVDWPGRVCGPLKARTGLRKAKHAGWRWGGATMMAGAVCASNGMCPASRWLWCGGSRGMR
jgi:hypothetical protein